jgi:aryl-alcohol dehydrogenase-like predicted oxidoreductase
MPGSPLLDTGDFYGMGHNELLIAEALRGVPRESYLLQRQVRRAARSRRRLARQRRAAAGGEDFLAYTLQRLGTDYVDIYSPCAARSRGADRGHGRRDRRMRRGRLGAPCRPERGRRPKRCAGQARSIRSATCRIEYALTTRNIERAVLPACRELGIGVTAYGVFSRGLLTGGWRPGAHAPGDFRTHAPRFQGEAGERNLEVAARLAEVAAGFGLTAGQVALGWVLAQGDDIVPLVGARRPERVAEAVAALEAELGADQLAALEAAIPPDAIAGERYATAQMAMLDSER